MEFLLLALLLASLGGNYWLITRVLRPVRRLSERTQRMAQGDLKALEQNCGGIAEVHALRVDQAKGLEARGQRARALPG
ncbi:HAMP domain-containing protein, partial [Anaerolineae bacterium CFX9]|nr:HAMP domain-containing protein [Anaerolineae bacterium CFX9]